MKPRIKNIMAAVLAVSLILSSLSVPATAGMKKPVSRQGGGSSQTAGSQESKIRERDERQNGITVGEPKVYDDALLQQMLQAAEARLASLQFIDQASIAARLGSVTGASQQVSSFGLNIQGAPVPQTVTTSKGATETTTQSQQATPTTTTNNLQTVSTQPAQDVTTTRAAFAPPPVTTPAPATALPTTFSVSASDILNEQAQLTAEVSGLRLLTAGSLTDAFKFKTTLGFPITVITDKRYKDAVAVVEVEVEPLQSLSTEPHEILPSIQTLLPREKTYNVATITDKSSAISGGVATQLLGVSASFMRARRTYYLVQDQDTVALTFRPEASQRTGFMWEFRPVLGQRYVKSGLKQTFVQLAFNVPPDAIAGEIGRITVRSYWRKYDRTRGVHGEIIRNSLNEQVVNYDIPKIKLISKPGVFNPRDSMEDLGGGQMLIKLEGRFLQGTNIRIGSTILAEGDGLRHTYQGIVFTAPIADLATKRVFLVAHDGTEVQLLFDAREDETFCSARRPLKIMPIGAPVVRVTTVDDANSRVTLDINDAAFLMDGPPPVVMVIGQRVFGYSDAPLQKNGTTISAIVPTALLVANPKVTVQTLFAGKGCSDSAPVTGFNTQGQTERLIPMEQGKDAVKFLLYGKRLDIAHVISPAGAKLQYVNDALKGDDTIRLIELTNDQLKANKQLLVMRDGEQPFFITIPALEAKKLDPPKASERVTVGADEVVITGDELQEVAKISFRKKDFKPEDIDIAGDGKSLRLSGLRAMGVTQMASTQSLVVTFKSGRKPAVVQLEVVNTKVENVSK